MTIMIHSQRSYYVYVLGIVIYRVGRIIVFTRHRRVTPRARTRRPNVNRALRGRKTVRVRDGRITFSV